MKNKKKLLFLTRLYLPHGGGVEKHVYEISKILSVKYQITIVTEQHDKNLLEHEICPEAEIYRIPVFNISEKFKKFVIWKWIWLHRQLFLTTNIIHIHDVFFWYLPIRLLYLSSNSYMTFHGYENVNGPNPIQKFWHQLAAVLTKGNICIGGFHAKWYGVIPTYTSFGAVDIQLQKQLKRSNKAIYIGRLAEDTGVMSYLESVRFSLMSLDVYGAGPLQNQAKKFVADNKLPVSFFGFVPKASASIEKYQISFTSGYLGILESLLSQTPVVSYYQSALKKDYLYETPFSKFIKIVHSPQEIAKATSEILQNPTSMKEAVQSGYNWAREQTWDQMCSLYLKLWQEPQLV